MAIQGAIYHDYKVSVSNLVFYSFNELLIVENENDTDDALLIGFSIIIVPNDSRLPIQTLEYGEDPSNSAFINNINKDAIRKEMDRRLAREYTNNFLEKFGNSQVIGVEEVYKKVLNILIERLSTVGISFTTAGEGDVWYPPTTFPILGMTMPGDEKLNYQYELQYLNGSSITLDTIAQSYYNDGDFYGFYDTTIPTPIQYNNIIRSDFSNKPNIIQPQINKVESPTELDNELQVQQNQAAVFEGELNTTGIDIINNPIPDNVEYTENIVNIPSQITTGNNITETLDNSKKIKRRKPKNKKRRQRAEPNNEIAENNLLEVQEENTRKSEVNIIKKKVKGRVIDSVSLKPISAEIIYSLQTINEVQVSSEVNNEPIIEENTFNFRLQVNLVRPNTNETESGLTLEEEAILRQTNVFSGRRRTGIPGGTVYIIDENNKIVKSIKANLEGKINTVINLPIRMFSDESNFTKFRLLFRGIGTQTIFEHIKYINPNDLGQAGKSINDKIYGDLALYPISSNSNSFTRDTPNGERVSRIIDFLSLPEVSGTIDRLSIQTDTPILDGSPNFIETSVPNPDENPNFNDIPGIQIGDKKIIAFTAKTDKKGRFSLKFGTSYNTIPNTIIISKEGYSRKTINVVLKDGTKKTNLGDIKLINETLNLEKDIENAKLELSPNKIRKKVPKFDKQTREINQSKKRAQFLESLIQRLVPTALRLGAKFGISKLEDMSKDNIVNDNTKCPTPNELDDIIRRRNNLADKINSTYKIINTTTIALGISQTLISTINILLNTLQGIPIPLGAPLGVGVPANVVTTISSRIEDKKRTLDKLSGINTGILLFLAILGNILQIILKLLSNVDKLVDKCAKDQQLTPINPDLLRLLETPEETDEEFQNFTFEIETEKTTNEYKRRRAIAKDINNVVVLKGEFSFAADTKILIDELKFFIRENNLKSQ
jgi:hypothetical protein